MAITLWMGVVQICNGYVTHATALVHLQTSGNESSSGPFTIPRDSPVTVLSLILPMPGLHGETSPQGQVAAHEGGGGGRTKEASPSLRSTFYARHMTSTPRVTL